MRSKPIRPDVLNQILSPKFHDLFWSKVAKASEDECWIWQASFETTGYGQMVIRVPDRQFHFSSHKLAWVIHHQRDVPDGLMVLHSCIDTRSCCNPNHLRPGDHFDNAQDAVNQGRHYSNPNGERAANVKLVNESVLKMRELYATGEYTNQALAGMFGVCDTRVWEIVTRKAWTHI